jgi:cob(I)alamin adenosyltransferase
LPFKCTLHRYTAVFEALGDTDELNSYVGVARTFAEEMGAEDAAKGDPELVVWPT